MRSLVKNSVSNVIYSLSNMLFPLLTSMYVSRVILAEGVGQVSYAQTVTSYFITFAAMGLPAYGIRQIAKVRSDREEADRVFSELMVISVVTTAVAVLAFLTLVFLQFRGEWALYLCCGIQLALNCTNIDWFYRGQEEYTYIVCRGLAVKLISLAAIVLFVKQPEDYVAYALISSLAHGGSCVFNIIHARKFVRFRFRGLNIRRHLLPVGIFALTSFLTGIYSKLDITMLGTISGSGAVGLYTNAHDLSYAVTTLCAAVSTAFLPRLSNLYETDREKFLGLIETGFRVLCFFAVPMAVGVFLLAPSIVELVYGKDFSDAAATLRILSVLILVQGFGNLLCYQLAIATGNERKRIPAYAGAAAANAGLNALLIPAMAQNGAAIATVISELVLNIHQFMTMRALVPYRITLEPVVRSAAAAGVMAVYLLLTGGLGLEPLPNCVLSVAGGAAVYTAVNLSIKYFIGIWGERNGC